MGRKVEAMPPRQLIRKLYPKEADFHRKEECINYDTCLQEVAEKRWASFSCHGCEDYCEGEVMEYCLAPTIGETDYVYPEYSRAGSWKEIDAAITKLMKKLGVK